MHPIPSPSSVMPTHLHATRVRPSAVSSVSAFAEARGSLPSEVGTALHATPDTPDTPVMGACTHPNPRTADAAHAG